MPDYSVFVRNMEGYEIVNKLKEENYSVYTDSSKKDVNISLYPSKVSDTIGASKFSYLLNANKDYKQKFIGSLGLKYKEESDIKDIRVTLEAWYNGRIFIKPYSVIFYDYKLMNKNLGPDVPCSGFSMTFKKKPCKLYSLSFDKIELALRKLEYVGPISFDFILKKNEIYVKDIKANIRFDFMYGLMHALDCPLSDFFFKLDKNILEDIKVKPGLIAGIHLSYFPFPLTDGKSHVANLNCDNLYLNKAKEDKIFINGNVGAIVGIGDNLKKVTDKLYKQLNAFKDDKIQYRTDFGKKISMNINIARRWGWLK